MAARYAELAAEHEEPGDQARSGGDPDRWSAGFAAHARGYSELFRTETFEAAAAALFAPDLVMRDHRPVGTMRTMDHAAYVEQMRSIAGTLRLRSAVLVLLETDGRLRLARGLVEADAVDGGFPIEFETYYVSVLGDDGRVRESHMFAGEEEARTWWEHRRGVAQSLEAYNGRDLIAVRRRLHDDFIQQDLRPGRLAPAGPDEFVASIADTLELVPDLHLDVELLAVSGDRRAMRYSWSGHLAEGGGAMELVFYLVTLTRDGRNWRNSIYETADEAIAALHEAEGSEEAHRRSMAAWDNAYSSHDLAAMRNLLHPNFVVVDHRSSGAPPLHGADAFLATVGDIIELIPDVHRAEGLLGIDGPRRAVSLHVNGHLADGGGAMALDLAALTELRDGVAVRQDLYETADEALRALRPPEADADLAQARLEEGELLAAAMRAMSNAFNARDWEAFAACLDRDFAFADHRPGLRDASGGRDAFVENGRALADAGDVRWTPKVLEQHNRVALVRSTFAGTFEGGPFEVVLLDVPVIDEHDRFLSTDVFGEDQEAAARERLQELAGGDALSPVARMYRESERAFNAAEWTAHPRFLRDDYHWTDHRPGLVGETRTREEFVAMLRAMREGNDLLWTQTSLEERADGLVGLARIVHTGTYRGGPYEIPVLVINAVDDDGRSFFAEMFAEDDPAAWTRLEELALHHGLSARMRDAFNARDLDALRSLVAEDFRQDDRRSLGADPITSLEEYLAMQARLVEAVPDMRLRMHVMEVAGDRRLSRQRWTGHSRETGGPLEVELWSVTTVADGRNARSELFDAEEEARACFASPRNEPDQEPASPVARKFAEVERAFNEQDWEGFAAGMVEDYHWVDHRPGLRMETRTRDEFVGLLRQARGGEGLRWRQTSLEERAGGRVGLARVVQEGTYRGGPYEIPYVAVIAVGADDRTVLGEMYAEDDPAAWRRLEALARELEGSPGAAVGAYLSMVDAFNRRDWPAFERCVAPGLVGIDHRPGLRSRPGETRGVGETFRRQTDGSDVTWTYELLAATERHALHRGIWAGTYRGGAYEAGWIDLIGFDDAGRVVHAELFPEDAEAEARARLEELRSPCSEAELVDPDLWRVHEDEQAQAAPVAAVYDALVAAFNDRDWERFAALNHPDFELHDHRPLLRAETLGLEAMVANFIQTVGDGDLRWTAVRRVVPGDRAEITLSRWSGTTDGAPFEVEYLDLHALAEDGRLVWSHMFTPEQEDEARARLDELASAGRSIAAPGFAMLQRGFNEEDWSLVQSALREDYRWVDHRPGLRMETRTREEIVALFRGIREGNDLRWEQELLDERAAGALAMTRVVQRGTYRGGPYEIAFLAVSAVDEDGRFSATEIWADGDPAAEQRMEELAAEPPVLAYVRTFEDAFNRRDWDAMDAVTAEEMVNEDHRPFGSGRQVEWQRELRALVETIPDAFWRHEPIEILAPGRALLRLEVRGAGADGGHVEIDVVRIVQIDEDGRYVRGDLFEDEASARNWLADQ